MTLPTPAPHAFRRSEVDDLIEKSLEIITRSSFALPPFAQWTPMMWQDAGPEWNSAREARLGWDVTDFGLGRFKQVGRVLFTLRNGISGGMDKPYAEKIIVGRHGQRAPAHFHLKKIEDIINRGGGDVVLSLTPPTDKRHPAKVYQDGKEIIITPNTVICLKVGESVCLPPGIIHQFWGEETEPGAIPLIGEVSSFCDDVGDNVFFEPVARFASIIEDEPARYCLCHELPAYREAEEASLAFDAR